MKPLQWIAPLDGTFFLMTEDKLARGCDQVQCRIKAPKGHQVTVNGQPCIYREAEYRVTLPLPEADSFIITAKDMTADETSTVEVYRRYIPQKAYRVSVDDNIWFLQNIARNQEVYNSIFDDPYLAMYRRLYEAYGTKFHFNIYYTCPEHGSFSLPALSDKFKDEWQSVNDWMTLSFHAKADSPIWPYQGADYQTVYDDCKAVMDEIERFAGYRGYVTTLHFADTTREGVKALYDCGVRLLLGDFSRDGEGKRKLCYYLDEEQFETVRRNCFYRDPDTKMIFFACDTVLNTMKPEQIREELAWLNETYPDRAFVDILIHEQYFYSDYENYLPDYEARLKAGIEFCREQGYVPMLAKEIIKM